MITPMTLIIPTVGEVYRSMCRLYTIDFTNWKVDAEGETRAYSAINWNIVFDAKDTFLVVEVKRVNGYEYAKVLDAVNSRLVWIIGLAQTGVCLYYRNVREELKEKIV